MIEEDYRKCDEIWQRVSPELNPYPEARAARERAPHTGALAALPAAANGDCCMGDAARRELETIEGFLREELANAQTYRCLAQLAPSQEGRRLMRRLAADASANAGTLQSAYFLITGGTYRVTVVLPPQAKLPWCDRLRERWHAAACGGANYKRASERTADACLRKLFAELSHSRYAQAEAIRKALERAL